MPLLLLVVPLPDRYLEWLRARYEVVALDHADIEAGRAPAGARIVWTNGMVGLSAQAMTALAELEIVICQGVGYDAVDLETAAERGVAVANGEGVNSTTVADHALALLLAGLRRVPDYDRAVHAGEWSAIRRNEPILTGKRVGLLGLGHIGREIGRRLQGFDCDIVYHARRRVADCSYAYAESAHALAEACEILVVCCPGGPATHHLVDAALLDALGPSGYLVNIARGTVVDTDALLSALHHDRIAGAAIDVVEGEPAVSAAVLDAPRLLVTPHTGGLSWEAFDAMIELGLANLDAHFAGRALITPIV